MSDRALLGTSTGYEWELDPNFPEGRARPKDLPSSQFAPDLSINGISMHVEAYKVRWWRDGELGRILVACDDSFEREVAAICDLEGSDCWPQVHELPGLPGEWLVVAFPYGD